MLPSNEIQSFESKPSKWHDLVQWTRINVSGFPPTQVSSYLSTKIN